MIRLITKDNARVGMVVNVHEKNGEYIKRNVTIKSMMTDEGFYIVTDDIDESFTWDVNWIELVSMPERRRLSWDWVKEHIDESIGMKCWVVGLDNSYYLSMIGKQHVKLSGLSHGYRYDEVFIDPPHPVIEEVPEPWLVEEEEVEPKAPEEKYKSIGRLFLKTIYGG